MEMARMKQQPGTQSEEVFLNYIVCSHVLK